MKPILEKKRLAISESITFASPANIMSIMQHAVYPDATLSIDGENFRLSWTRSETDEEMIARIEAYDLAVDAYVAEEVAKPKAEEIEPK